MRNTLLLTLALLSLAFAPVPFRKPDPVRDDLERLQGAWVLYAAIRRGEAESSLGGEAVWTITGGRLDTSLNGKPGSTSFLTLHGGPAPRGIDLRDTRLGGRVAPGRYRVDGDTLRVCIAEHRPGDLSGNGPSECVWVFKRKRP